nr:reverse transcriptase domain-containing protein [Tanacetum cinerariifolium]
MTATLKYRDVPNDAIKLMLFPYSLEDRARIWYEKEPPNSILTWEDLVNKFVNQFFPPSKTTHLKNEISRCTQRFDETFSEAWDRFKELLRACPHHGFSELTQIDTFYNGLTEQDHDSPACKSNVARVNTNSRDVVCKTDDRIDKLADQISNLVEIVNKQVVAPARAVEKVCVHAEGLMLITNVLLLIINVLRSDFSKQEENLRKNLNDDMRNILSSFFQNQPSTSGTLPSNTIPNPKGKMKVVTIRSVLAYEGPSIPAESPLEKVDEQNTDEILDKEHSNSLGSTAQVQPPVANFGTRCSEGSV